MSDIPYSGKFSQEKMFANFVDGVPFAIIFPANISLYYVVLCLDIEGKATHAKNFSAKILILRILRKIFSTKISHYTVYFIAGAGFRLWKGF